MPKPSTFSKSEVYREHLTVGRNLHERNDCSVRAIAAASGQSYDYVHGLFAAAGRKTGKGTRTSITNCVVAQLGLKLEDVPSQHFLDRYPPAHRKALRNVTTHHADRFPAAWADGHTYVLFTTGHMLAVVNGVNHDWTRGNALRVKRICRVVRWGRKLRCVAAQNTISPRFPKTYQKIF